MKPVSPSDLNAVADQLERTARVIRAKGNEAVRRARDWATPLKSTQGFGPKNEVSRPTENAALNFDSIAEEWTLLTSEAGRCFDATATLESRVVRIATDAVIENQRAGIGSCADGCGRYCDGTKDNRLRMGLAPACYKRESRKEAKAG